MIGRNVSTKAVKSVLLNYCVDREYLVSVLSLDFIAFDSSYEEVKDRNLREYQKSQATASRTAINVDRSTGVPAHLLAVKSLVRIETLKTNFKNFKAYCLKLREELQVVHIGPSHAMPCRAQALSAAAKTANGNQAVFALSSKRAAKARSLGVAPVCLFPRHTMGGLGHSLCDCKKCPEGEKRTYCRKHLAKKLQDGPASNTRRKARDRNERRRTKSNRK